MKMDRRMFTKSRDGCRHTRVTAMDEKGGSRRRAFAGEHDFQGNSARPINKDAQSYI